MRHIEVVNIIDHFDLTARTVLLTSQFLQRGFQHILQISGVSVEIEVHLGVGEVLWVLTRDGAHNIVGQLRLTGTGSTDNQCGMADVQVVVDELLGGDGFTSGDGERTHLVVLLGIEINNFHSFGPFFEFDLVSGLVNEVIEDRTLLRELDGALPLALPPVREFFSVVDTILFDEPSSASPAPGEYENIFDVLAVRGNHNLQAAAQRDDHGNLGDGDHKFTVLLDEC